VGACTAVLVDVEAAVLAAVYVRRGRARRQSQLGLPDALAVERQQGAATEFKDGDDVSAHKRRAEGAGAEEDVDRGAGVTVRRNSGGVEQTQRIGTGNDDREASRRGLIGEQAVIGEVGA